MGRYNTVDLCCGSTAIQKELEDGRDRAIRHFSEVIGTVEEQER